jgi:hypothetical protein
LRKRIEKHTEAIRVGHAEPEQDHVADIPKHGLEEILTAVPAS